MTGMVAATKVQAMARLPAVCAAWSWQRLSAWPICGTGIFVAQGILHLLLRARPLLPSTPPASVLPSAPGAATLTQALAFTLAPHPPPRPVQSHQSQTVQLPPPLSAVCCPTAYFTEAPSAFYLPGIPHKQKKKKEKEREKNTWGGRNRIYKSTISFTFKRFETVLQKGRSQSTMLT